MGFIDGYPMKILIGHNHYRIQGGEDLSFLAEVKLLRDNGHEVFTFIRDNNNIKESNRFWKIKLALNTIWSQSSFDDINNILKVNKPDIVHFQNTFPLISPSVFYAAKKNSLPVVVSIRNYRLFCLNGLFIRDQKVCEYCFGKTPPWPGVLHSCYRKSRMQSAVVASMLTTHRILHTYRKKIDLFITPSKFSREKLIQSGFPKEKVFVKPNFIMDPGVRESIGEYVLYVGRLSIEKGIQSLIQTIRENPLIPFVIGGDGPFAETIYDLSKSVQNLIYWGQLDRDKVFTMIKGARFLVFPSICYETFGRVAIEAYACGVPVIASRIGAITEIVNDQETGLLTIPRDSEDLSKKVNWLWNHPEDCKHFGQNARTNYIINYTPEINYRMLIDIYKSLIH